MISQDRFIVYENNDNWFTQDTKTFLERVVENSEKQIPIHYWNTLFYVRWSGYHSKTKAIGHISDLKINTDEQQARLSGIVTFYDRHEDKIKILLNPFGSFINCNLKDNIDDSEDVNVEIAKIDIAVFAPKELRVVRNR